MFGPYNENILLSVCIDEVVHDTQTHLRVLICQTFQAWNGEDMQDMSQLTWVLFDTTTTETLQTTGYVRI